MKVRSRASSIRSGASTPGGGPFKSLSEGDLRKADEALSEVNGTDIPKLPSVPTAPDVVVAPRGDASANGDA